MKTQFEKNQVQIDKILSIKKTIKMNSFFDSEVINFSQTHEELCDKFGNKID